MIHATTVPHLGPSLSRILDESAHRLCAGSLSIALKTRETDTVYHFSTGNVPRREPGSGWALLSRAIRSQGVTCGSIELRVPARELGRLLSDGVLDDLASAVAHAYVQTLHSSHV